MKHKFAHTFDLSNNKFILLKEMENAYWRASYESFSCIGNSQFDAISALQEAITEELRNLATVGEDLEQLRQNSPWSIGAKLPERPQSLAKELEQVAQVEWAKARVAKAQAQVVKTRAVWKEECFRAEEVAKEDAVF